MTLEQDLSRLTDEPKVQNLYESHFLLENPFPGHGETRLDVCTDQEPIKKEFLYTLQNFSLDAKRLRIDGKNGAGKTNILRYFEQLTNEARRSNRIKNLHPIYIYAPGESYFDIHAQIVDRLSELFLGDLLKAMQSNPKEIERISKEVKPASELMAAIKSLVDQSNTLFAIYSERHEDALIRWLKGQKLTAGDRRLLSYGGTPLGDVANPSLAIRFLNGFLAVLKSLSLCDGIVLLFDEFEEIFEGLTRARQSRYAQDLRHLFDTLKEMVFFVIATVPEPKDLGQYPAIERRLGTPREIKAIDSQEQAIDYVLDYLNSGRRKYELVFKDRRELSPENLEKELRPLTERIVRDEYLSLEVEVKRAELDILPGYFLPRMRERIRQIVESQ